MKVRGTKARKDFVKDVGKEERKKEGKINRRK
jgi:hypothetical protein